MIIPINKIKNSDNEKKYILTIKNIESSEVRDVVFNTLYEVIGFIRDFSIELFDDILMEIISELYLEKTVILEFNELDFNYIKERTQKEKQQ
jgi:hypothetical protein